MNVERVNGDTSFFIKLINTTKTITYLLDPWLLGSEIDCSTCFNEQYLIEPSISIDKIGKVDAIIISHEFSDHCHEKTLLLLDENIPILSTKSAINRLKRNSILKNRTLIEIPTTNCKKNKINFLDYNDIKISLICASGIFDYVHNALIIIPNYSNIKNENEGIDEKDVFLTNNSSTNTDNDDDKTMKNSTGGLLYSPHGIFISDFSSSIIKDLVDYKLDILLITMTEYKLPLILGGTVNLGLIKAKNVSDIIKSKVVIDCHSEKKKASGIIPFISRPVYPSKEEIKKWINNFLDI